MGSVYEFTVIGLLLVISPGPNGALIFKTSSTLGSKHALINISGLVTATFFHGAFSIFGLSAIIKNIPALFITIKSLGAIYLFYIGGKAVISAFKMHNSIKSGNENEIVCKNKKTNVISSYIDGFLTQILNPKVSMFYLAAFPLFIDFGSSNYVIASFLLVAIHASIIFSWFTMFVILFNKIKLLFNRSDVIKKYTQAITGFVLIYFGLLILRQSQ